MAIENLHTVEAAVFNTRLRSLLGQLEGNETLPYMDIAGVVTIGIGFNIALTVNRIRVYNAMGLTNAQRIILNNAFADPQTRKGSGLES